MRIVVTKNADGTRDILVLGQRSEPGYPIAIKGVAKGDVKGAVDDLIQTSYPGEHRVHPRAGIEAP